MTTDIQPAVWECRHGISKNEPVECHDRRPLYDSSALDAARKEGYAEALVLLQKSELFQIASDMALEEAAKVCENERHLDTYLEQKARAKCAAAIRALKK